MESQRVGSLNESKLEFGVEKTIRDLIEYYELNGWVGHQTKITKLCQDVYRLRDEDINNLYQQIEEAENNNYYMKYQLNEFSRCNEDLKQMLEKYE